MNFDLPRPRHFLLNLITILSFTLLLGTLALIVISKPQEKTQELHPQAIDITLCDRVSEIPRYECLALERFFRASGGPNWRVERGEQAWFTTSTPCAWFGIKCSPVYTDNLDPVRSVIALGLSQRRLVGQLNESFADLPRLEALDLSGNQFTGNLQTSRLLAHPQLRHLNLGQNQLTGTLDYPFTTNQPLRDLLLDHNNLTGALPANLALLSSLQELDLRATKLSGALPKQLERLSLDKLLTAESELCLPSELTAWYQKIRERDGLRACTSPPPPTATATPSPSPTASHSPTLTPTPTSPSSSKTPLASCNLYCADSSECRSGLSCWYNRCRHPENITSLTCLPPAAALREQMNQSCNTPCNSNRDCSLNLRCYQGACRLANNPTEPRCQAPSQTKGQAPTPSAPARHSLQPSQPAKGESLTPTPSDALATESAQQTPSPSITPHQSSPTPLPSLLPSPKPSTPASETNVIGNIWRAFVGSKFVLYLLAGLGLIFLFLGFVTGKRDQKPTPPPPPTPTATPTTPTPPPPTSTGIGTPSTKQSEVGQRLIARLKSKPQAKDMI